MSAERSLSTMPMSQRTNVFSAQGQYCGGRSVRLTGIESSDCSQMSHDLGVAVGPAKFELIDALACVEESAKISESVSVTGLMRLGKLLHFRAVRGSPIYNPLANGNNFGDLGAHCLFTSIPGLSNFADRCLWRSLEGNVSALRVTAKHLHLPRLLSLIVS
jgi:hypothetical protein